MTRIAIILLTGFTFLFTFPGNQVPDGKRLYEKKCARCHGKDGTKGMMKASNLKDSRLNEDGILLILRNGKKSMPAFQYKLTDQETKEIALYVKRMQ